MKSNSRERLSTGTNAGQVLGAGETLVADKVVEESHDVAAERSDLALSNERVDGGVAVGAAVQLEGVTIDGRGGNGATGGGDGAGATKSCEPNHDLVGVGSAGGGGGEDVV